MSPSLPVKMQRWSCEYAVATRQNAEWPSCPRRNLGISTRWKHYTSCSTPISIKDPKFDRCRNICLLFPLERQEKVLLRTGGMYKWGMMDSYCRDCSLCYRAKMSASAFRRSTADFRGSAIRKRDDSSLQRFRIKRWNKAVQHPLTEKKKSTNKKRLRIPWERLQADERDW